MAMAFSARLPHVNSLYCCAVSERFQGVDLSATGLGETAEKAFVRCNAELAEGKSFVLGPTECFSATASDLAAYESLPHSRSSAGNKHPKDRRRSETLQCTVARLIGSEHKMAVPTGRLFGRNRPKPKMPEGIAAGTDPDMALQNAILETIERYASLNWWLGVHRGKQPSRSAVLYFDKIQSRWARTVPRRTGLLDISPDFGIPVFVAWSHETTGRGLCFGTASGLSDTDAVRAAFRELLQMEFGLDVARYRQSHGVKAARRERIKLARASRLGVHHCKALLAPQSCGSGDEKRERSMSPEQLAKRLACNRIRLFAVDLVRPDDRHFVVKTFSPDLQVSQSQNVQAHSGCALNHRENNETPWIKWELY